MIKPPFHLSPRTHSQTRCLFHVLNLEKTYLKQAETNQCTDRLGYGGTELSCSQPPTFHTMSEPQISTEESHGVGERPPTMLSLLSLAAGDWAHLSTYSGRQHTAAERSISCVCNLALQLASPVHFTSLMTVNMHHSTTNAITTLSVPRSP